MFNSLIQLLSLKDADGVCPSGRFGAMHHGNQVKKFRKECMKTGINKCQGSIGDAVKDCGGSASSKKRNSLGRGCKDMVRSMTGRDESFLSEDALDEEDESESASWDSERIKKWSRNAHDWTKETGKKIAEGTKDAGEKVADSARSAAHKTKETAKHVSRSAKHAWKEGDEPPSDSEDYDSEDSSDYDWDEDEEDSEVCIPFYH